MNRCFGSYSFVLAIVVLGFPVRTLAVDVDGKNSWTWAAVASTPQQIYAESSLSKTGDPALLYQWHLDVKSSTPFGYSLAVKSSTWARSDQAARREPIALLSPDLSYLAIGTESCGVQVVDRLAKQKTTNLLPIRQLTKPVPDSAKGVQDLAFLRSAGKMTLIVADGSSELTQWDLTGGNLLASLAHDQAGAQIAFVPGAKDSLIIAIGSQLRKCDSALKKWDAQQKLPVPIVSIATSEYRRIVAVATADRSISLFDGETLTPLQSWKHSDGKIDAKLPISLAVSAKGDRVFTATRESQGTVTVWDAKTGKKTGSFTHREPDGTAEKSFRLSATLDGKVESQWVVRDGYGHRTLLWSPPEGVEFMPPADLWLVHAKALKVHSKDGGWETSEWVVLHAYTGDPDLKGKSFTLSVLSVWGTSIDRVKGWRVQPGEESFLWIKRRKAEGDLVAELGLLALARYDPECAFPGWQPDNQFKASSKTLAEMIEKLNECDRDSERVRLLVKNVVPDSVYVTSWSLWWLEPATFRSKVASSKESLESEKKVKLTVASQAVERVAKHAETTSDFFNLSCCFSLFVPSVAAEHERESNGRRAVELLEQAIEKGWNDVERIKNESDLDSLRNRADFKKVLAALETRKAAQPSKMK
ncbi:MAG: hypothetical protein K8U57_28655 [Planctomycetes bacterium]|nr:hypothetical protein [Planctomycetota bacterium]